MSCRGAPQDWRVAGAYRGTLHLRVALLRDLAHEVVQIAASAEGDVVPRRDGLVTVLEEDTEVHAVSLALHAASDSFATMTVIKFPATRGMQRSSTRFELQKV